MGAGKTVKGGIELVETFLKELNKPAKAAVKVAVVPPQVVKGAQDILPAAEREANLAKFLEPSAIKERLYHGTGADITEFRPSKIGALGPGTYLSKIPNIASEYSKFKQRSNLHSQPNVLPVYVQAKNPFVIGNVNDSHEQLFKHFDPEGKLSDDEVIQRLIDSGYDSVYAKDSGELNILDPSRIKSAIGNRGTYDINDPDITKAKGGEVHMGRGGVMPKKTTVMEDIQSLGDPAMALADMLAGKLRGTTAAATGFYGDMEDLVRKYGKGLPANVIRALLPTREGKETLLPTVEEMNAMLPPVVPKGASRSTHVGQTYNDLGVANPLAPTAGAAVVKGAKVLGPVLKAGALDLARSEPARRALNRVAQATGAAPMMVVSDFPQEEALVLAQQRAALPRSQYGLGLPSNNTPEQRAAAMQFLDDVYHATDAKDDFTSLIPSTKGKIGAGVYTSPSPSYTEKYAGENARILPLLTRGKFADQDLRIAIADQMLEDLSKTNPNFSVAEWKAKTNQALKDQGYAGVDVGQERLVFDPENIRSRFAAFDPFRKDAATAAAMGVAAPDLLAEEQRKAIGGAVMMADGGMITIDEFLKKQGR